MSEFRFDPYHGTWVAIATIRGERPHDFRQLEARISETCCPFCRGREHDTPPAVLELAAGDLPAALASRERSTADQAPWLVRVIPNKYPALTPLPPSAASAAGEPLPGGPGTAVAWGGFQELVIESPRHVASLSDLTAAEMFLTLRAVQRRLVATAADPTISQVSVFMNCRSEAGASLEHAHAQLVYNPFVAEPIAARWRNCARYWGQQRRNLLQALRQWELESGTRILDHRDGWTAFCPFASRFPFQIWIVPPQPHEEFPQLAEGGLLELGRQIQRCVQQLEQVHPRAPYNLLVHLPPRRPPATAEGAAQGWFVEIVPRLGRLAGYELLGAGWINEAPPEFAARLLRESPHREPGEVRPAPA